MYLKFQLIYSWTFIIFLFHVLCVCVDAYFLYTAFFYIFHNSQFCLMSCNHINGINFMINWIILMQSGCFLFIISIKTLIDMPFTIVAVSCIQSKFSFILLQTCIILRKLRIILLFSFYWNEILSFFVILSPFFLYRIQVMKCIYLRQLTKIQLWAFLLIFLLKNNNNSYVLDI